ncbi:secretion protein HlyD, partial [Escherichia coli]
MRFLIFSIRTLLLRFNHRPGRIFFAVEKITQLETGNDSNLLIVFYVQIMPDD